LPKIEELKDRDIFDLRTDLKVEKLSQRRMDFNHKVDAIVQRPKERVWHFDDSIRDYFFSIALL
jgi:hypothetical protein